MGHRFQVEQELELAATPEQVWDAIATGPGMDCWFLGHNEVSPGLGGTVRSDFAGGAMPASTVTAWEPGERLAVSSSSDPAPDQRFLANEYLIAAQRGGSSVLRIVTSGFLPGDDWEAEFEAMQAGSGVFRSALAEYLAHFAGRTGTPITLFGPPIQDWPAAWRALDDALGLASTDREEPVHLAVAGIPPIAGELYAANDQSRSVRTPDGLYRFVQGFFGPMVLSHVLFGAGAPDGTPPGTHEQAWQDWLDKLFG